MKPQGTHSSQRLLRCLLGKNIEAKNGETLETPSSGAALCALCTAIIHILVFLHVFYLSQRHRVFC
ncbi:MAG: hypothetical protein PHO37_12035, partial [Kiritimatiellae bacterium]|nr:hypothetical protein [Kiritimatiellia bacterium]